MNENEKTLKALALIAAELYVQNEISLAVLNEHIPGYPYHDEKTMEKITNHFYNYFEGGSYHPGSIAKFIPMKKS